tara:strand:+ start:298 stop:678 length:381 start_codon:yes stop_codon:yes gene_type:complete
MDLVRGKYSINVTNDIIMISLAGSFNQQEAKVLTNHIRTTISTFQGKPFSILVVDTGLTGNTPDAYSEINEYNKWLNTQNMTAKALVTIPSVVTKINDSAIPAKAQQNLSVFDNVPDALAWLKSQS